MIQTDDRGLAVECRPLDRLIPYAKNARTRDDGHVAQIPIRRDE